MSVENKEQFIANIDTRVNAILAKGGGDESLLMSLPEFMTGDLKELISSAANGELDVYYQKYAGFYRLMKLMEDLARGIAGGSIKVP